MTCIDKRHAESAPLGQVQTQRPELRQVQRLKMTPQLVQAVRLMALPLQELKATIDEELEKNPALTVEEDRTVVSLESLQRRREGDGEGPDLFDHSSDRGYSREAAEEASEARRAFLEGVPNQPESLQEHLLWQLALQPIGEDLRRVAGQLVRNLDEHGFHEEPPETLVKTEADRRLLAPAMELVQGFDPVGTCVKDVRESLEVQVRRHPDPHPRALDALAHFELLEHQRYREVERLLKVHEDELRAILAFIRTLDPLPGRHYSRDGSRYVVPDVAVVVQDGEFTLVTNDEAIPVLGINTELEAMARQKSGDRTVQRFAADSVAEARWFIRTVNQRNLTLLKVCRAIVEFQRDFFLKGPKDLRPLTLKDVAAEIGVHEATVSRITTAKYLQTDWGIFELKHFFSNAVAGPRGPASRFSKGGVKEIVREIVTGEQGRTLSDREIVGALAARGIAIARRTVAKYRGELAIESSYQRRRV
jgi:RNA polymerase sigma-54 factor